MVLLQFFYPRIAAKNRIRDHCQYAMSAADVFTEYEDSPFVRNNRNIGVVFCDDGRKIHSSCNFVRRNFKSLEIIAQDFGIFRKDMGRISSILQLQQIGPTLI